MNIVSPDVDTGFIPGSEPGSYIDSVNISIDNIKEQILHFYYSLIRTNNVESQLLLNNLLSFLFTYLNISNGTPFGRLGRDSRTTFVPLQENELKGNPPLEDCPISTSLRNLHRCNNPVLKYLVCLYCLIGNTRDSLYGKNEQLLTYSMIYTWNIYAPVLANFALNLCVNMYGNWKDVKCICQYVKDKLISIGDNNELIQYSIKLLNEKIHEDTQKCREISGTEISEAAKCAPRQTANRHGWIFNLLSQHYYINYSNEYNKSEKCVFEPKHSIKAKTEYRKIITNLSQKYDDQSQTQKKYPDKLVNKPINPYPQMYIPKMVEINIDPNNIEENWKLLLEIVDSPRYESLKVKMIDYLSNTGTNNNDKIL
jgi:hypothetical protein